MDCASFHLLHPHGTKSIEGKDLNLMKEYSYGDTLKGCYPRPSRRTILTAWQQNYVNIVGQL